MKFRNVEQIASWRLCLGCGACISACPEKRIKLVDFEKEGLRPVIQGNYCETCAECVKTCPGWEIGNPRDDYRGGILMRGTLPLLNSGTGHLWRHKSL